MTEDLDYRNLEACRVKIQNLSSFSSSSSDVKLAVQLPLECWETATISITPHKYDFNLEKSVLKKISDTKNNTASLLSTTTTAAAAGTTENNNNAQRATLMKLKSVTGASEDVCIELLENNKYDLKTSIEAYLQTK
mmetsp:Transcript_23645/g.33875  ORF Transcript_23645/g.33875 Transcript_23645/m.33875 type:complete len:136 (-) Transcript_23645:149-556(-)|eukprot:CAMPEP_0202458016 /NCGR_PEP_ID=MMETSP1360-20130828/19825_1 /ASSEMBLY_ACC=CAM_ASM_000848 /TAXON_ID=515479 /ORGANISM="Licmophora paradoxa, Strain CCMP2313" /LENGTH=135 /DNA_ID=CAMNT_0049078323 /DNA_START=16 /DNA_END=423 /DNA_ORIENTATION=+